ncbi:hypothetical protein B0H19DRAFT_1086427 [Mycena capillaripes]|nr:hypothetical protein B0H19DRAFT_1086427 [Mycena capillaripes]
MPSYAVFLCTSSYNGEPSFGRGAILSPRFPPWARSLTIIPLAAILSDKVGSDLYGIHHCGNSFSGHNGGDPEEAMFVAASMDDAEIVREQVEQAGFDAIQMAEGNDWRWLTGMIAAWSDGGRISPKYLSKNLVECLKDIHKVRVEPGEG